MGQQRIRADKQIARATSSNQILVTDTNGELQYQALATILSGGGGSFQGIKDITNISLTGNNLVLKYLDQYGTEQVKTVSLAPFAVDVKLSNATLLSNAAQGTYILQMTNSDGTVFSVDMLSLLAVVTTNSAYIDCTGNGTPAAPLKASLNAAALQLLKIPITEEFINLDGAPTTIGELRVFNGIVTLSHAISTLQDLKVYRNGMRALSTDYVAGINSQVANSTDFTLSFIVPFGITGIDKETVIVDYNLNGASVVGRII